MAEPQYVMPDDEREHECAALAAEAVNFIVGKLAGTRNIGFRGTHGLENEIYGWLWDHAVFEDEVE